MAGVEAWALVDDVATCPENIPGVREPPERPPPSARGDEGGVDRAQRELGRFDSGWHRRAVVVRW